MKSFYIYIILFLILCCAPGISNKEHEIEEIKTLQTVQDHKNFLSRLLEKDQGIRNFCIKTEQNLGADSKEYRRAMDSMRLVDTKCLFQAETYLEIHGFPNSKLYGKEAPDAIFTVLHHANKRDVRKKHFHHLYQAYLEKDISGDALAFFLNRMYYIKYNRHISWGRPYRTDEELDTLFKKLDLIPIVNEVSNNLDSLSTLDKI